MRIMILGATGMLGNAMFRVLSTKPDLTVFGTGRSENSKKYFTNNLSRHIIVGIDVENHDSIVKAFSIVQPDVVINCIGLVKQLSDANDPLQAIPINTLLPHRLAALSKATGARLVHISTDCVFSGAKGNYRESDPPDVNDLYGLSKLLGEVNDTHTITLRTSIIGHELSGNRSLMGWFLNQKESVKGFSRAIFSGLPTVELSHVVAEFVLPRVNLHGLYHVAAEPINKYDLLKLVAQTYRINVEIIPSDELVIDRSLNADRFNAATGYSPPSWPILVQKMYAFK